MKIELTTTKLIGRSTTGYAQHCGLDGSAPPCREFDSHS